MEQKFHYFKLMKKIILLIFFVLILIPNYQLVSADHFKAADPCGGAPEHCPTAAPCRVVTEDNDISGFRNGELRCIDRPSGPLGVIGNIIPPQAIRNLGFGATGISRFLSNLVVLIYALAAIVLLFMILWGAFDWITSEGDKEKLERARNKLINAFIGILLFAAAFAIIQILGAFTGFQFFST